MMCNDMQCNYPSRGYNKVFGISVVVCAALFVVAKVLGYV